ncbi:hypothetical protein EIP91_008252 [Steccherinum ochraceum]|uniref:THH1/TOM1/TOM3 domain-containing protein n=1 Tax=Steccherinum ochraceum TaxID=92696 RepID=A0A4R0R341_9APHY|nr:hypothetical protein EIP91_008252 [Steccherinum ochraceum]
MSDPGGPVHFTGAAISAVFLWEFLVTFSFDWGFVKRKRAFQWPMIVYFLGRYLALLLVIMRIVQLTNSSLGMETLIGLSSDHNACTYVSAYEVRLLTSSAVDICKSEFDMKFFVYGVQSLANMDLAIRVMIFWSMNWWTVVPIVLLMACQWIIVIWNTVKFTQEGRIESLAIALVAYSLGFSVLMLILTSIKLGRARKSTGFFKKSLQDAVFVLVLFVVINFVFIFLTIDPEDFDTGLFPAAVICAMLSGRLVRRKSNYSKAANKSPAAYLMRERHFGDRLTSLDGPSTAIATSTAVEPRMSTV